MTTGDDRLDTPALEQLGNRLSAAEAKLAPPRGRGRLVAAAAAAVVAVALLVGLSFTPPGRVVAGEVGALVGIGDEPTVEQHAGNEGDSVVVGTGETPSGQPIELVAHTLLPVTCPPDKPGAQGCKVDRESEARELCFALDLSVPARGLRSTCITSPRNKARLDAEGIGWVFTGGTGHREGGDGAASVEGSDLVVSGTLAPRVADAAVTYRDPGSGEVRDASVLDAQLTPELAERIGTEWTAGAFFAFLPEGVVRSPKERTDVIDYRQARDLIASIEVTAYDADGDVIGRAGNDDPDRWAGLLSFAPPARLVEAFQARDAAARECKEEGIRGEARPVGPGGMVEALSTTDPELEACIRKHLDAAE